MTQPRILLVDDHSIIRKGVKKILEKELKFDLFGEAETAQEAIERIRQEEWDLVILDITLADQSGLGVLKFIKESKPSLPVLMLSMHPEDQFAVRFLRAGASGYLSKNCPPEELVTAVSKVLGGGRYVSPALAETLAFQMKGEGEVSLHRNLSDREFEILRQMAEGKTVTEIAKKLVLSVKTISTYRARILEKLKMENNAELIRYAITHGLVETPLLSDKPLQKNSKTPTEE